MAALPDITAFKLDAIVNPKEGKDFRNIHPLLLVYSLGELLVFLPGTHLAAAPAADRQQLVMLLRQFLNFKNLLNLPIFIRKFNRYLDAL